MPYERTSELIQIQELRQTRHGFLQISIWRPEKTSLLGSWPASGRMQTQQPFRARIPSKPAGIARSSRPPRQFRRVRLETPRKLQVPANSRNIRSAARAIRVADYAAQAIHSALGAQIRREVSANWKTSRDRPGNLPRRRIIIGEVSRIQSGSPGNAAGFVEARSRQQQNQSALTLDQSGRRGSFGGGPSFLETSMETPGSLPILAQNPGMENPIRQPETTLQGYHPWPVSPWERKSEGGFRQTGKPPAATSQNRLLR